LCFTGNSAGQPPSGINGIGPLVGPPELKRLRSPCGFGFGEGDGLLEGDPEEAPLDETLLDETLLGEVLFVVLAL
jgi:hypothetical protein